MTFFANALFERRNLTAQEWMPVLFAVLGLYLILMQNEDIEASVNTGFMCAVLAGIGYGLCLVLNKKLKIGGFWCTTKSLTILKSQAVQLVELSDPIFASMLGFVFLGQLVTSMQMLGGACACILAAILIHEIVFFRKNKMAADTSR